MKLCRKLASLTIFSGMLIYFGAITAFAAGTGVVSADVVNVRSGPSLNETVIEKLVEGQVINANSVEGDWFNVDTQTAKNAFVNKEFLNILSADATVNSDNVNIRSQASTSSEILGKANAGMKLSVTAQVGDFYVFSYSGQKSYIHKDFVDGSLVGYVEKKLSEVSKPAAAPKAELAQNAAPKAVEQSASPPAKETTYALVLSENGVNLRNVPSQDGDILNVLSYSEAVDVLEIGDQWHKVSYNGMTGYISSEFSMVKTGIKPDNSVRTSLVNYAKQFLGTKYVWGGTNLKTGVDCSGFTYSVYKNFGITLNRSSSGQPANGRKVSKSELVAGDLVFFDTSGSNNGSISHVGIYMGDGNFIHASSSSKNPCVTINNLSEDYYVRTYVTACRVL